MKRRERLSEARLIEDFRDDQRSPVFIDFPGPDEISEMRSTRNSSASKFIDLEDNAGSCGKRQKAQGFGVPTRKGSAQNDISNYQLAIIN